MITISNYTTHHFFSGDPLTLALRRYHRAQKIITSQKGINTSTGQILAINSVGNNSEVLCRSRRNSAGDVEDYARPYMIGIYNSDQRRTRIQRFLDKRNRRLWTKKVKYDVRKV